MEDTEMDVNDMYQHMSYDERWEMVDLLDYDGFSWRGPSRGECILEKELNKALYKIKKKSISLPLRDIEKIIEIADAL
jgi:hypothetical protein